MRAESLYHVSERGDIRVFLPKPPPSPDSGVKEDVVWAIEHRLLHNYLLPRDCPRVTFYAGHQTESQDVNRFFLGSTAKHVVAVEAAWLDRIRTGVIWLYAMPPDTFTVADATAGYHVSSVPVVPTACHCLSDILGALIERDVELRIVPNLWKLRDAVLSSSLHFSMIRMRNAQPRSSDDSTCPTTPARV